MELILVAATQTSPLHRPPLPPSTCRPSRLDNKPPERYWWMCEQGREWGLGKLNWCMNVGILHKTPLFSSSKSSSFKNVERIRVLHVLCTSDRMVIPARLVKNLPVLYRICRYIAVFRRTRHLSLPWIQCTTSHPTYLDSTLILASRLLLVTLSTPFLREPG